MDLWETFVEVTTQNFKFLETDFNFDRREINAPFIFYRSDKIEVRVYYGISKHFELGLGIRKLADDPRSVPSLHIPNLIMLSDRRVAEECRQAFASTEEDLKIEVQHLAKLLKKYGTSVLKGEDRDFEKIARLSKEYEQEINERVSLNRVNNRVKNYEQ